MADLSVTIRRTNAKLHFEATSDLNPNFSVPFDFAPPMGDGQGFTGLEMLLVSFAGCVSTTIVFILSRLGAHIETYTATAEGTRSEHPLTLKAIHLALKIRSDNLTPDMMDTAIHQAEAIAPVWQAVKNNIEVSIGYEHA